MDISYRQTILQGIKILVGVLLMYTIYTQISDKLDGQEDLIGHILDRSLVDYGILCLVLCLMPLNWYVETCKWQSGLGKSVLGMKESFYSILAGTTLALITPARVGEYGGRLLYIDERNRGQALYATLLGSILQNIMNVGIGGLAVLSMMHRSAVIDEIKSVHIGLSIGFLFVILLLVYRFRFHIFSGIKKYVPIGNTEVSIALPTMLHIGAYSFLRYAVYVLQYALVAYALGLSDDVWLSIMVICSIYFFQSILPLPALLAILARSEIAILLWSGITDDTLGILTATFLLWIVNLIIPSICGYILMIRHRPI